MRTVSLARDKIKHKLNMKRLFLFRHGQMSAARKMKGRECRDESQSKRVFFPQNFIMLVPVMQ